jgi:hypothetical protein
VVRKLTELEVQRKLNKIYGTDSIKVVEHTFTAFPAVFKCYYGHLFEQKLHYILYNKYKNPCPYCAKNRNMVKKAFELLDEEQLVKDLQYTNRVLFDIIVKHKNSEDPEVRGVIRKTFQKYIKEVI